MRDEHNKNLFNRSGEVSSSETLVAFLYTLIRDGYVSPGNLEKIMRDESSHFGREITFSNGYIANYAIDLAERLK